jgi:hypothetical protein
LIGLAGTVCLAQRNVQAGTYYHGDGLSMMIYINIQPDRHYSARWSDDVGVCGVATGTWTTARATLTLSPTVETGMFREHPLHVFQVASVTNLVATTKSKPLNGKSFGLANNRK